MTGAFFIFRRPSAGLQIREPARILPLETVRD